MRDATGTAVIHTNRNGANKMTTYSMTEVIAAAKASNNGRLLAFAMTVPQKRAAEKAVARGLMFSYSMNFPGFGFVMAYSVA